MNESKASLSLFLVTGNCLKVHTMGLGVGVPDDRGILKELDRPLQPKHDRFQGHDCFKQ